MTRVRWMLLGLSFAVMPLDDPDHVAAALGAEPAGGRPVVRRVTGFQPPRAGQLPGFVRTKPNVMESEQQLADVFGRQQAGLVIKQVDLNSEYLLLFQWAGSGQDKLDYEVQSNAGVPTAIFSFQPGRTRDLRPHAYLYAITRGVEWQIIK